MTFGLPIHLVVARTCRQALLSLSELYRTIALSELVYRSIKLMEEWAATGARHPAPRVVVKALSPKESDSGSASWRDPPPPRDLGEQILAACECVKELLVEVGKRDDRPTPHHWPVRIRASLERHGHSRWAPCARNRPLR